MDGVFADRAFGNGNPRLARDHGRHPSSKIPSCGCAVPGTPESMEMTDQIDWRAKQLSQYIGLHLGKNVGELETLPAGAYPRTQGLHTNDRLEERGVERGSVARKRERSMTRERTIVNQINIGTTSNALVKLLRDWVERT